MKRWLPCIESLRFLAWWSFSVWSILVIWRIKSLLSGSSLFRIWSASVTLCSEAGISKSSNYEREYTKLDLVPKYCSNSPILWFTTFFLASSFSSSFLYFSSSFTHPICPRPCPPLPLPSSSLPRSSTTLPQAYYFCNCQFFQLARRCLWWRTVSLAALFIRFRTRSCWNSILDCCKLWEMWLWKRACNVEDDWCCGGGGVRPWWDGIVGGVCSEPSLEWRFSLSEFEANCWFLVSGLMIAGVSSE